MKTDEALMSVLIASVTQEQLQEILLKLQEIRGDKEFRASVQHLVRMAESARTSVRFSQEPRSGSSTIQPGPEKSSC